MLFMSDSLTVTCREMITVKPVTRRSQSSKLPSLSSCSGGKEKTRSLNGRRSKPDPYDGGAEDGEGEGEGSEEGGGEVDSQWSSGAHNSLVDSRALW